ncbi:MAG TPA: 1-acyl-sn-glycerol-3-phosphate acyltransferase [Chitinophagales bacterium]|nr:1-acyl-sn-glycerol-3-phosphate acyltransferase [Chitinophagales bacterium]
MGKLLSRFIFWLFGWKLDARLKADFRRCVMIAAPHTSNWDFIFARAAFSLLGIPVRFTVKHEWLRFPFKGAMLAMGAIGIDRSPKKPGEPRPSMTDAMIDLFKNNKELVVLVTPEGTRSLRTKWKTGFYHVAVGAGVPVALGYLDFKNKVAGVGKIVYPSGDMQKDMHEIMEFYKDIPPKHPEKFSIDQDFA